MKLKIIALLLFAMSAFSACVEDSDVPMPPKPKPAPEMGMRTMLVYIAGDNSLSSSPDFASLDLEEMIVGAELTDTQKNNLIVYMDRRNANPQLIRICHNSENKIVLDTLQSYPARNSVGVSEMKEVLSKVYTDFPAEHYGLSLWSHGEGWLPYEGANTRWIGQDKTSYMNIQELCQVLEVAPHLDFILFDACFMQSVEVAYELRNYADYFIASLTEIPGPGAPYDKLVSALLPVDNSSLEAVIQNIVQQYYDPYAAIFDETKMTENVPWTGGVSIGALKSSALSQLAIATKQILTNHIAGGSTVDTSGILYYGRGGRYYYYYDMDGLMRKLTGEDATYIQWKQAFDAAMVRFRTTKMNFSGSADRSDYYLFSMEGACGLSTYVPRRNNPGLNTFYRKYEWYTAAGWNLTGW